MKLFFSKVIQQLDVDTITMGTPQLELIDNASETFVRFIKPNISKSEKIVCLCGTGNNGVDGLVIALKLVSRGYQVSVICIESKSQLSVQYLQAKTKVHSARIKLRTIHPDHDISEIEHHDVIIDGIFGNGLNRPLDQNYANLINAINGYNKKVFAIDIPSGIRAEGEIVEPILHCTATLAFQIPRLSFFQREAAPYLGNWMFLPIGINKQLLDREETDRFLVDQKLIRTLIRSRDLHGHKGTYGTVVLIGGNIGMAGSIILSASASMKIGAGKCTIVSAKENRNICQVRLPEASFMDIEKKISDIKKSTLGVGPGLGTSDKYKNILSRLLQSCDKSIVLDADALNIIANNLKLLLDIPKNSIITPHTGEFHSLFGAHTSDYQRISTQTKQAQKHGIFIVLKGKYTTIACPDGQVYYNNTGNAGMATGGSGDVLTGIITGLLAQTYTPKEACIIGVYLHGLGGDIAKETVGEMSLMARDLISYLPNAVNSII